MRKKLGLPSVPALAILVLQLIEFYQASVLLHYLVICDINGMYMS